MSQKVITALLGLIIIGGLVWYFQKNYLQPSLSNKSPITDYKGNASETSSAVLVYANLSNQKEIWQGNTQKETKKLYTDVDETWKVQSFSNLATKINSVYAIVKDATNTSKLVAIDLSNAKEKILQDNFQVPSSWAVSLDGSKIAVCKFSNVEANYGYTLYVEESDGTNVRQLANNSTEIRSLSWSSDGKNIAYLRTSGDKNEISIVNVEESSQQTIFSTDKIIDSVSWTADGKILYSARKKGETKKGEIDIVDSTGKNTEKVLEYEGGVANYVYLEGNMAAYLIAQYSANTDDKTLGQIYFYNTKSKEKTALGKDTMILGFSK